MSVEFEYVILNKLCKNAEYFNKALPILASKHFSNIGNQHIFTILKAYYGKYKENPSITEIISKVRNVENVEVRKTINDSLVAIEMVEESKNLDFIVDETLSFVKDSMYLEALRVGSDGLMKCDEELKKKAEQIMDARAKVNIDSDLGLDFDDIQQMIDYYQERNIGIMTQHLEFNKRLGSGFLPSTLSLIMAASGIGKSLLMTDLISGFIKQGKNILLVSLEMGDKEIMKRVHANVFNLPINSLIDLSKTDEEKQRMREDDPTHEFVSRDHIEEAYNKLKSEGEVGNLFIKDYPSGTFSALQLEALVESYRMEKGIEFDAIFVDYIGIAKSDLLTPNAGLYSYIKSIVEEFRSTAKKLKLPIISANQLNRSATNNTEADNSSVSDSMGAVMTADFIMFLLQDEEMKKRNEIHCKITKNRFNGRTDSWNMYINYTRMSFHDLIKEGERETYEQNYDRNDVSDSMDIMPDYVVISPENEKYNEEFGNKEIPDIVRKGLEHSNEPYNEVANPKIKVNDDIDNLLDDLIN